MYKQTNYVVVAEHEIAEEDLSKYVEYCLHNANTSMATEPGCLQYYVQVSPETASRVILIEVYEDRAAFEAHRETEHFKLWQQRASVLIKNRRSQHVRRVDVAST